MSQPVHLEVFYPYPLERVWKVLTDRRALANWMMENDFEPKLGHKFRFYSQPLPGLTTTIQCEVVELEEPNRLVYTWQEFPTAEPSLVVWTLTTVAGGTQLRLKHHQYSYTTAVASLNSSGAVSPKRHFAESTHFHQRSELFYTEMLLPTSGLAVASSSANLSRKTLLGSSSITEQNRFPSEIIASEFFSSGMVEWEYLLNQTLPNLLAQD